jgi:hypothetical protein
MNRMLPCLLAFCCAAAGRAQDSSPIKFPSPDGRFALRVSAAENEFEAKIELVEKSSGKAMLDFESIQRKRLPDTVLLWSPDSKWVAYGTRNDRQGETNVYFWNGSAFEEVPLPDPLPGPEIKYRKGGSDRVKNYGGATKPLKWLKSGALVLSSDLMMLRDDLSYTGTVEITIAFDAQHHASVQKVSKTKTKVE